MRYHHISLPLAPTVISKYLDSRPLDEAGEDADGVVAEA
jgi:hypothetical protein